MQAGADAARVRLSLPCGPVDVLCDPVRDRPGGRAPGGCNALQYSAACEPVDVGLVVADGRARVIVTDRGPGIPPTRSSASSSASRARGPAADDDGGAGLGLHLARSLATAMAAT
jgi:hypothetical protein